MRHMVSPLTPSQQFNLRKTRRGQNGSSGSLTTSQMRDTGDLITPEPAI